MVELVELVNYISDIVKVCYLVGWAGCSNTEFSSLWDSLDSPVLSCVEREDWTGAVGLPGSPQSH